MGSFVLPFLFEAYLNAKTKETKMRKPIFILVLLLVISGLSACARAPVKAVNNPDDQRSRSHGAQDELSTEVHK
jgi:hypothetical protein